MNISSYNITDVSYHYIGLRVTEGLPSSRRTQTDAISRGVHKIVNDRALRLMLPEPRGTFEAIGGKVCQELVHLGLASSGRMAYSLTDTGKRALTLLESRDYVGLRRLMVAAHLETYDNFRAVLQSHLEIGFIWRPVVESARIGQQRYIQGLLEPTFGTDAANQAFALLSGQKGESAKRVESLLHERVLSRVITGRKVGVALFRAICDRLLSLRLLNIRRTDNQGYEFLKSYSPCVPGEPARSWYIPLEVPLANGPYRVFLCEPDMTSDCNQRILLQEVDKVFATLSPEGGYYDIPSVRDSVCERLMIPEASFDEGMNQLLNMSPPVLSAGLHYDRISGRRKPLILNGQIRNLVRSA